jgi:hypothetical protein
MRGSEEPLDRIEELLVAARERVVISFRKLEQSRTRDVGGKMAGALDRLLRVVDAVRTSTGTWIVGRTSRISTSRRRLSKTRAAPGLAEKRRNEASSRRKPASAAWDG